MPYETDAEINQERLLKILQDILDDRNIVAARERDKQDALRISENRKKQIEMVAANIQAQNAEHEAQIRKAGQPVVTKTLFETMQANFIAAWNVFATQVADAVKHMHSAATASINARAAAQQLPAGLTPQAAHAFADKHIAGITPDRVLDAARQLHTPTPGAVVHESMNKHVQKARTEYDAAQHRQEHDMLDALLIRVALMQSIGTHMQADSALTHHDFHAQTVVDSLADMQTLKNVASAVRTLEASVATMTSQAMQAAGLVLGGHQGYPRLFGMQPVVEPRLKNPAALTPRPRPSNANSNDD